MFYSAGPRSIQLNFKLTLIEPKKEAWTEFKSGISFFVAEKEREREREEPYTTIGFLETKVLTIFV